jgi:glutamine amidotransferase
MTKNNTAIINYGMGNIWSLKNALDNIKINYQLVSEPENLKKFSHIILPGVGSAKEAYQRLEEKGFVESVTDCVIKRDKKILGICVGMQLMGESTEEDGGSKCFGFFENRVLKLKQKKGVKLPHVGFNSVSASSSSLFESIEQKDYNQKFVSAVIKDNIFGTQFHPEISQNNGLKLLNNFFNKC